MTPDRPVAHLIRILGRRLFLAFGLVRWISGH